MPTSKFDFKQARWPLFLLASLAAVFVWLVARNHGLYPVVFADEMLYSAFARLTPLAETSIPSYLYFAVYGVTNACGTDFLSCTRILNSLFLVGAGPFIYLTARAFVGRGLSFFVMLLAVLAPINAFTAFFMPETMYFFAFFVLSWIVLTRGHWHWATHAGVSGALLGLMAMVKVHAVFLVPALALYLAWLHWPRGRIAAGAALVAVGAAVAVKFGAGYAIAGAQGLFLFGSFYGTQATNSAHHALSTLIAPGFISMRGHLMSLAVLFGVPMALLASFLCSRKAREEAGPKAGALQAYTILMLGAAAGMAVLYTATIADFGPREAVRLHMRYYNFVFPLLLIVTAAAIGARQEAPGKALRYAIGAALVGACLVGAIKLPTYFLGMVDGPDIAPMMNPVTARWLALLSIVPLLVWTLRRRGAAVLFLFAVVPVLTVVYHVKMAAFQAQVVNPGPFDKAGLAVRDLVPPSERKDITVAGTGLAELMRAKFHIDERGVTLLELPDNAPFDLDYLPVKRKWLVVVGPHPLPPELEPVLKTPDLALVKIGASHRSIAAVAMNGAPTDSLLAGIEGLAGAESWGRWSNAKEVVLRFKDPLPKRLNVVLTAQAFGPNAEQQFIARVGDTEKRFRVPTTPTEVFLRLENDGKQDTLRIVVPQPVSPASLGLSVDKRTLGIGLINVEIGTPPN